MRRLLRWTFNTLAIASLLLCLATAALWVRSYWVYDKFLAWRPEASGFGQRWRLPHYRWYLASYRGQLTGAFDWSEQAEGGPTPPWQFGVQHHDDIPNYADAEDWTRPGFAAEHEVHGDYASNTRSMGVPTWTLVSAFALLPAIVAFRQIRAVRRRRRRSRLGLCPACGYDLRASPDRCPECGRADDKVTR